MVAFKPSYFLEKKGAFKRSYCLYFRGEGSLQTELLQGVSNRATASILELNRVSGVGGVVCASILEEMGAFKRSYCIYFRGERESSNEATASILEEKGISNRATASIFELNRVSGVVAVPCF